MAMRLSHLLIVVFPATVLTLLFSWAQAVVGISASFE